MNEEETGLPPVESESDMKVKMKIHFEDMYLCMYIYEYTSDILYWHYLLLGQAHWGLCRKHHTGMISCQNVLTPQCTGNACILIFYIMFA